MPDTLTHYFLNVTYIMLRLVCLRWRDYPGHDITYGENPCAHSQVEFASDVDQVAEGNYAPKAYHD